MFTGIVQDCQPIQALSKTADHWSVTITTPLGHYQAGDSILLHGICSTVVSNDSAGLTVEYMAETIRLTTVSQWQVGQPLHIEASATLQTPLSGWLVTGHVDTIIPVLNVQTGTDYAITLQLTAGHAGLVMLKGGITLNGVNLTVTAVTTDTVTVQLVPYTLTHTTLNQLKVGDRVNVEFDHFAKLAQRYWSLAQS